MVRVKGSRREYRQRSAEREMSKLKEQNVKGGPEGNAVRAMAYHAQ